MVKAESAMALPFYMVFSRLVLLKIKLLNQILKYPGWL